MSCTYTTSLLPETYPESTTQKREAIIPSEIPINYQSTWRQTPDKCNLV